MTTDQEMNDLMTAHVRGLVALRDALNDEIDKAEQLLQDVSNQLAESRNALRRATTPERMTVAEATRYLRVSKNTIKAWIAEGSIPHHVDADERRYLLKSDVDQWLTAGCPGTRRRAA